MCAYVTLGDAFNRGALSGVLLQCVVFKSITWIILFSYFDESLHAFFVVMICECFVCFQTGEVGRYKYYNGTVISAVTVFVTSISY